MGNLGDLFIKLGKWDEAEQNFLESIRLCTSLLPAAAMPSPTRWLGCILNSPNMNWHKRCSKRVNQWSPFFLLNTRRFSVAKQECSMQSMKHRRRKKLYEQAKSIAEEIDKDENSELRKFIREVESDFIATSTVNR